MAGWGKPVLGDVRGKFIAAVRCGNYYDTACRLVGISRTTLYRWLTYGRVAKDQCTIDPDGKVRYHDGILYDEMYAEFLAEVEQASAEAESDAIKKILETGGAVNFKTGTMEWQALAWFLERRFPQKYGKRVQVEDAENSQFMHTGDDVISLDQMDRIADVVKIQAQKQRQMIAAAEASK